jgi:transposase
LAQAQASERRSLTQAVRSAVRAIEEAALQPVARHDAGLAFEPRTLLALLSYCYARDIYGSVEIEDVLRRDTNFCLVCNNEFPGARVIRRFRRENRQAIHRCLTAALCSLVEGVLKTADNETAKTAVAEDASRRIMKAMFIDSMETDWE